MEAARSPADPDPSPTSSARPLCGQGRGSHREPGLGCAQERGASASLQGHAHGSHAQSDHTHVWPRL